jgi:aminocarboxymuconate-semialdehyde decarboxylase
MHLMLKIDSHTHILPRTMPNWAEKFGYGGFIQLEVSRPGFANMMRDDVFFREIASNCWDAEERIEEYGRAGVQVQVISTIPVMFSYWAKSEDAADLARFLNAHIAEIVRDHPKHYVGLCSVPMQDPDMAIEVLEEACNQGHRGVQIGSNVNGLNLGDSRFFSFYEACQRLNMSLFIHPWDMMGKSEMERYWLPWLVGMPAETSRAACSMIFSGVLDKFPALRILFSHAGGSFLPTIGRIKHGHACRPDLVAVDNPTPPDHYLGKFWVDSITHDPRLLRYILEMQGPDRICMGTDYPFPLGDLEFGQFMEGMDLNEAALKQLFAGSTLSWLGMDWSAFE